MWFLPAKTPTGAHKLANIAFYQSWINRPCSNFNDNWAWQWTWAKPLQVKPPPPPTPTVRLICRHLSWDFAQQLSIPVNISTFDPMDEEAAPLSFPVCGFFQVKFNSLTSLPECGNVFEALRKNNRTIIRIPQIRILLLQITSRLTD